MNIKSKLVKMKIFIINISIFFSTKYGSKLSFNSWNNTLRFVNITLIPRLNLLERKFSYEWIFTYLLLDQWIDLDSSEVYSSYFLCIVYGNFFDWNLER